MKGRAVMVARAPDLRDVPTYEVPEAAHYLHVPASTLRAWAFGQSGFEPVIEPASAAPPKLSFRNLVECHVLAAMRREHRIPMQKIRLALENVRKLLER